MWTISVLLCCLVAASEAPRADRRRLEAYNVQEVAKLTAAGASSNGEFGWSVAIDGDTVVVGTSGNGAYVLRTTDGWATHTEIKLTATDAAADDWFGGEVAIDGDTVVIGAPWDDDGGSSSGSAYVFRTSDGGQVAKLTASDAAAGDQFGRSVAINGNTIVIGAHEWATGRAGKAYVFHTSDGGATLLVWGQLMLWVHQQRRHRAWKALRRQRLSEAWEAALCVCSAVGTSASRRTRTLVSRSSPPVSYVFVAAMRRASAGLRAEGADADDETRDIMRQQKRTVARVVAASVLAVLSTFVTYLFPMIYGYVSPNFWRKRSMIFLITFIVDSVVNDLCLMAVAFVYTCVEINQGVDVKEDEKTSAAAVPIQPAPDFDSDFKGLN